MGRLAATLPDVILSRARTAGRRASISPMIVGHIAYIYILHSCKRPKGPSHNDKAQPGADDISPGRYIDIFATCSLLDNKIARHY